MQKVNQKAKGRSTSNTKKLGSPAQEDTVLQRLSCWEAASPGESLQWKPSGLGIA